jgi:hypothetical protein
MPKRQPILAKHLDQWPSAVTEQMERSNVSAIVLGFEVRNRADQQMTDQPPCQNPEWQARLPDFDVPAGTLET